MTVSGQVRLVPVAGRAGAPRRRSRAAGLLLVLLAGLLFTVAGPFSPTGQGQSASGLMPIPPFLGTFSFDNPLNNGCIGDDQYPMWVSAKTSAVYAKPFPEGVTPNAQEWYTSSNLNWTPWRMEKLGSGCGTMGGMVASINSNIANMLFDTTGKTFAGEIGIDVFSYATTANISNILMDGVSEAVASINDKLYTGYLAPIILLGTLWIAWNGLVKKRTRDAFTGAFWMVLAGGLAGLFFINVTVTQDGSSGPERVSYPLGGVVMKEINEVIIDTTSTLIGIGSQINPGASKVTTVSREDGTGAKTAGSYDLCSVKGSLPFGSKNQRETSCVLWYLFSYRPWAEGQFGEAANLTVSLDEDATISLPNSGVENSRSRREVPVALAWLDATTIGHDHAVIRQNGGDIKDQVSNKPKTFKAVIDRMTCGQDLYKNGSIKADATCDAIVGHTAITGGGSISTVVTNLFAIVFGMVPLLFMSLTLIFYQFLGVLLFLAAPLFLLIGIHPGFGRKAAMSWVEMLVGNILRRLGTALLMSLMILIMGAALSAPVNTFVQILLVCVAGTGVFLSRDKILDSLSQVRLGGSGANAQVDNKIEGVITGSMAGGLGTLLAGGGFGKTAAKGAATGALVGSKTGGTGALMAGYGTGAAVAMSQLQKTEQREEADRKAEELAAKGGAQTPWQKWIESGNAQSRAEDRAMNEAALYFINTGQLEPTLNYVDELLAAGRQIPAPSLPRHPEINERLKREIESRITAGGMDPQELMREPLDPRVERQASGNNRQNSNDKEDTRPDCANCGGTGKSGLVDRNESELPCRFCNGTGKQVAYS